MELLQIKYFCDTAESENLSHTARKHCVPTSGVSQSIKRLERELGAELFFRRSNKITLSEEGRLFYSHARRALSELDAARSRLVEREGEMSGEISILAETNRRIVTLAIEEFKRIHPAVNFSIHHTRTERTLAYEAVISDSPTEPHYSSEELLTERILLAVNRTSELAEREFVSLSELRAERFISMSRGSRMSELALSLCREAGFIPNVVISTDDPYYVRKYVEMGLGVAIVPEISWKGLFSSDIKLIPIGDFHRTVRLFLPSDGYVSRRSEAFCALVRKIFKEESER